MKTVDDYMQEQEPELMKAVDDYIHKLQSDAAEKAKSQEELRTSEEYQDQLEFLRKTIHDFSETLTDCAFTASRWEQYYGAFLFQRHVDDILEAANMVQLAVELGALNSARRELRFILEVAVNTAYVDEERSTDSFEERVRFYRGKSVSKQNVDQVKKISLDFLGNGRQKFAEHVVEAWVQASNYVHLTKRQVDEKLALREQGVEKGFETLDMLKNVVDEVHEVCSIVIVLAFNSIGQRATGSLLVDHLDDIDDWAFHASGYVALVDAYYDQKNERQHKLLQHQERRKLRVRYHAVALSC
ncbi:hypothetical protein [Burkholderia cenocepacia]|uniref:hypothetical protein n=1 Tax=Burkholderia cenocepacia TaxID=95486 RepID=UPI001CF34B9E|nr:hypothetical protein [Burkholderia cenocepacia]MCA8088889.1 hypothetical protein [Burkholderia cenocepacia]